MLLSPSWILLGLISSIASGPVFLPGNQRVSNEDLMKPYEFGFVFGDGLGMSQHRKEVSDENGVIRGQYGYLDPLGIYRTVNYTADTDGYKAVILSNEPGSTSQTASGAVFVVQPPPQAFVNQQQKFTIPTAAV